MAKLNKHLKERVVKFESGMTFIHHPLVVTLFNGHDMEIDHANGVFKHKLERIAKAEKEKDASSYVFTHERAYRFEALHEVANDTYFWELSKKDYWKLVADVWIDSENIYEFKEEWSDVLFHHIYNDTKNATHLMMTKEEKEEFDKLPNEITIYRGGVDNYAFSWTLDKEKAKWFAKRFSKKHKVFEKTINKKHALALFNGRGEKEIVYDFLSE